MPGKINFSPLHTMLSLYRIPEASLWPSCAIGGMQEIRLATGSRCRIHGQYWHLACHHGCRSNTCATIGCSCSHHICACRNNVDGLGCLIARPAPARMAPFALSEMAAPQTVEDPVMTRGPGIFRKKFFQFRLLPSPKYRNAYTVHKYP